MPVEVQGRINPDSAVGNSTDRRKPPLPLTLTAHLLLAIDGYR